MASNKDLQMQTKGKNNMKIRFVSVLATGLFLVGMTGVTQAALVQWATNGHYYEVVNPVFGLNWAEAEMVARNSTFQGLHGHLATVMNVEENNFIYGLLPSSASTWGYLLGGYQPENSQEPNGDWRWITGEPFDYTNWNYGEPNNGYIAYPEQDVLWIYGDEADRGSSGRYVGGEWDDMWGDRSIDDNGIVIGYVIEYDEYESIYPVPLPSTTFLFSTGIASLVGIMRRRKRNTFQLGR
jgi:hypothetical protein